MASNTLYPPIVDGYMPAFDSSEPCKIYFSLSHFNEEIDLSKLTMHISVTYQESGMKALDTSKHKQGIILDREINWANPNPYVTIEKTDLFGGDWNEGTLYKVQLRFSSVRYNENENNSFTISEYLVKEASNFSEWSTVCIIKPIPKPYINWFNPKKTEDSKGNTIYEMDGVRVEGFYNCGDSSELLDYYELTLIESSPEVKVYNSGAIYANNFNQNNHIDYVFKTELKTGENYKYTLSYRFSTINKYFEEDSISLTIKSSDSEITGVHIKTLDSNANSDSPNLLEKTSYCEEEEEGRILCCVYGTPSKEAKKIYIRRTDSKSDFSIWEDIYCIDNIANNNSLTEYYYDYSIESGIWYEYAVAEEKADGSRCMGNINETKVMRDFNYSFLVGEKETQLKLKFDNTLNNYKINISESLTPTIGSQYPFGRRTGGNYYKSFSINGLISFQLDDNNTFIDLTYLYDLYGKEEFTNPYNFTHERFFRDAVMKFLYNGKVKLFKSPTEGNILVRLTDISLTPNQTLDRMIYSFTANATEVADTTISNLLKYKIISLDFNNNDPKYTIEKTCSHMQGGKV